MHTRNISVGRHTLSIETGRLAKQADGSVIVRSGDTMVLVTACAATNPREGIDFLPLTVDYREYTYASGRIPGGFFKREGKATEKEVLTSRFIDRPIRPLFPEGWRHETQIIAFVISADTDHDSDVLAITGASAALALSSIPFTRTIAGVRMGLVDGEYLVNPTFEQRRKSSLDLIVAGSKDAIVMVEAGAKEVSEDVILKALDLAHAAIKEIIAGIEGLVKEVGKAKRQFAVKEIAADIRREVEAKAFGPADRGDADQGQARELQQGRSGPGQPARQLPGRRRREAQRREARLQGAQGEGDEGRGARTRPPARRPQVRRDSSDHHRSGRPAAHPRLDGVHARRNAGPGHGHPGHGRRPAEDRDGRRRDVEALHAPLQLPAVLGRRSAVPARPRTPRDRSRRARRARAPADDSRRRELPLHHPHRLRHPRIERLVVHGVGLRRIDRDDGRWRAPEGLGGWRRHGTHHGRGDRQARDPERYRRRRRPLRRHGLQGRRIGRGHHRAADGHQGVGHHARHHEEGARAGAAGPPPHPRQDEAGDRDEPVGRVGLRAADRHDPHSRSTRFATSSDRAAR